MRKANLNIDELSLTLRGAAQLLGISTPDLAWLEETGRINAIKGKYLLGPLVRAVIEYFKDGYVLEIASRSDGGPLARRKITVADAARLLGITPGRVSQVSNVGSAAGHLQLSRRSSAGIYNHAGECRSHLRRHVWKYLPLGRRGVLNVAGHYTPPAYAEVRRHWPLRPGPRNPVGRMITAVARALAVGLPAFVITQLVRHAYQSRYGALQSRSV